MKRIAQTADISVVVPLLNERGNLEKLYERTIAVFRQIGCRYSIIFVDDGSTDGSADVIRDLARRDPNVIGIRLSRNFGHEVASTAGLDRAAGDAVVLMDADLQDPPELIEEMIQKWADGSDIVYAVRRNREGERRGKLVTAWAFYRILNFFSDTAIPVDAGDFRLIDGKVVEALQRCREVDRFVRGLTAWTGFEACPVFYDRPARVAGETKYGGFKLLLLSIDAIIGFSTLPLRISSALGFFVMIASIITGFVIVVQKLSTGINLPGYALLASGLFFVSGIQMMLLGVLGEYIGRTYRQVQSRPLYLVREVIQHS